MTSSLKWFDGDSKEALQKMIERNCVFMVYIGKENDDLTEALKDPNIIQLLNNELILCYKMDPDSSSFKNFKDIFSNVVIPSIYLLEKNNIQQYIIKKPDIMESLELQLDLKFQILNAVKSIIKEISSTINVNENKQKYLQYLNDVTNKLQVLQDSNTNNSVQEVEKSITVAKIKIKVPCKNITMVQEFEKTSSLNDVKTYVLNNVSIPKRPIKFIAHRTFMDDDFFKTLEALNLCPSSTIYVHMIPTEKGHSFLDAQSWFSTIFHYTILNPYYFIQNFIMSLIRRPPSVEAPRPVNRLNVKHNEKKSTYRSTSNIHQLRDNNSDDDEKKTYNGNSTQQL